MTTTLEQCRVQDAWASCTEQNSEYVKLAKSVPALIMNSGLMQTLAFLEYKGQKKDKAPQRVLAHQLRTWLAGRFPGVLPSSDYRPFMEALMRARPQQFQDVTAEAMAWLRWVRQLGPACAGDEG